MKKLVGGVVVILLLAVAGLVGSAYWSGMQAERWYRDVLAAGSKNPNIKLMSVHYERGIFASHSVTRVQLALPESSESKETNPSFSIRQDIYHGPLPLAGWGMSDVPMRWGGAVVRAVLESDSSDWTRALSKQYGNQEPFVAIAQIGFDGASDVQITMPPLTLNDSGNLQSLNFSGLQGQFRVAPYGAAVQGKMTVAGLEVVGKPATSENQQPTASSYQFKLNHLAMTVNQRRGAFDLMLGESNVSIDELRVQDKTAESPVIVTHFGMDAEAALNPQNPQQVAVDALFKAERIATDKRNGSGSLRLAFHNLDGATVAKLQQWQQKLISKPDDPQASDELHNLVKALLVGKPEFTLDTQAKLTDEGEWQGKLTLNFQDFDMEQAAQNSMGFLAALEKGLANVSVSKALLEKELNNLSEGQAVQQLQSLTTAGFLLLEGDQYKSTARFEDGKLFVNDQEIPLATPADEAETSASGESTADGNTADEENETPLEPDAGSNAEEQPAQQ